MAKRPRPRPNPVIVVEGMTAVKARDLYRRVKGVSSEMLKRKRFRMARAKKA
jgi:hypothetical protein